MSKSKKEDPTPGAAPAGGVLRTHAPLVWFMSKFGALMALYYIVILLPVPDGLMYSYLALNARATNALLNLLGTGSHVSDVSIRLAGFAINVRRGCDAIEPAWFFSAAVVSFPGSWSNKIPGILVGTAIILAVNLARLVSLFLIGLHYPAFFAAAHLEIWPAAFIVLTVLLFAAWIYWTRRPPGTAANAAA